MYTLICAFALMCKAKFTLLLVQAEVHRQKRYVVIELIWQVGADGGILRLGPDLAGRDGGETTKTSARARQ